MNIFSATTPIEVAQAKALFIEYASEQKLDLCFQGFDEELATLPGKYRSSRRTVIAGARRGTNRRLCGPAPASSRACAR